MLHLFSFYKNTIEYRVKNQSLLLLLIIFCQMTLNAGSQDPQ